MAPAESCESLCDQREQSLCDQREQHRCRQLSPIASESLCDQREQLRPYQDRMDVCESLCDQREQPCEEPPRRTVIRLPLPKGSALYEYRRAYRVWKGALEGVSFRGSIPEGLFFSCRCGKFYDTEVPSLGLEPALVESVRYHIDIGECDHSVASKVLAFAALRMRPEDRNAAIARHKDSCPV